MNSENLDLVGSILMAVSFILLTIGGYGLLTNLPESKEKAMTAAKRELAALTEVLGVRLSQFAKERIIKSRIQQRIFARMQEREKALHLLVPGVFLLLLSGVFFMIADRKRKSSAVPPENRDPNS